MFLQLENDHSRSSEDRYFLINTDLIENIRPDGNGCIVRLKSGEKFTPLNNFDDVFLALREANLIVQPGR